jgi:phosphoenolpyruvate-protein phosphotransferase (PTS system enzyme I)
VVGQKEKRIWGIGAAPGIAEGKAYVLDRRKAKFSKRYIPATQVRREVKRVKEAIEKSKADLVKIKDALGHEDIHEHVHILDSHLMILEDPMLLDAVSEMIASEKKNGEWALFSAFENYKKMFDTIDNDYLKERKADFDYLNNWILKHLSGSGEDTLQHIEEKVIVIAHYLSPADAARMNREKVIGFVTDIGARTSHTAILARALNIPAVVGAEKASVQVNRGDRILLDGREGLVIVNPTQETVTQYREKGLQYDHLEKALLQERNLTAETLDGRRISLTANVEMVEEVPAVLEYGAEGIGLYRTEFLCLGQGRIPTEEEHFQVYRSVVERVAPFPVTIRTFDFGSDKSPNIDQLKQEMNPALGLRSIRYCLRESAIFKDQLRAILRASHYGKVRILFPMISGLHELNRAKDMYEEAKDEVARKGQPFDPSLEVGIMVEVPSAALIADVLAKEVDFFSIGTNDLIQYCLAIDRVNKEVAYLYEPLHPSILRLLKTVVEAGHREGIEVGMCGEMASDVRYIYLLVGFLFDHLSMVGSMVPWIKKVVRSIRCEEATKLVETLLQTKDSDENERILSLWIRENSPDITQKVLCAF